MANAKLEDAQILHDAGRYDSAVYLCGYAVEFALKACICDSLNWKQYPTNTTKYKTFITHDLLVLLRLSGCEDQIKSKSIASAWNAVSTWNPEMRYDGVNKIGPDRSPVVLGSARKVIGAL